MLDLYMFIFFYPSNFVLLKMLCIMQFLQSMPVLVNHRENMTADVGVRLLGGGLSGITAASVTYPLDLVRTRLAAQVISLVLW